MVRMSRVLAFLLGMCAVMAAGLTSAEAGYAHFIYDAKSGKILASENADVINHPASLTKMMTLYLTFEALRTGKLKWEQDIDMTQNAASKIPFKLGVKAGNTLTVREAVLGMAIRSANDAAAAMADHLGGSEDRFGEMMTRKARQLGMKNTVFRNASGLPDDEQVTTARDMATMAMALIRDYPREYQFFSMRSFRFRGKTIPGHNHLMYRYPGMDGVKTGFVNASGFNIASAVMIDGRRVIGVVMGGKSARKRDDQMAALLDQYAPSKGRPAADSNLIAMEQPRKQVRVQPQEEQAEKRPQAAAVPLAFASPRKEITLPAPPARAGMVNLYAAPPAPLGATAQQPTGTNWRIQVAAAESVDAASAKLGKALPLISKGFGPVAPSIESYTESGKDYFRARVVGFSDGNAASKACSVLLAKSMTCFVVR